MVGFRVDTPQGLQGVLDKAFTEDGPVLIEVAVGEMDSLWPYMPLAVLKANLPAK